MKKIISLILIIIFILSISITSVSASARSDFTRADAITLFKKSYDIFNVLQNKYMTEDSTTPTIILDENDLYAPPDLEYAGPCKRILKIEIADKEYDIKTLSDVVSAIEEYYVPELVDFFMICSIDGDKTIYEGPEGKVYFHQDDWMPWPFFIDLDYGAFSAAGNKATLEVYSVRVVLGLDIYYCKANIEFVNTENGWRVSGGPMFDLLTLQVDHMDYCYKYSFLVDDDIGRQEIILNPETGDTAATAVPALTAAAILSVALPTALLRKRRRYA